MKVTLTVFNRGMNGEQVILFGARHNIHSVNFGNKFTTDLNKIEMDDDYQFKTGNTYANPPSYSYFLPFLMDCIKYDLRVISINGKSLKKEGEGEPVDYLNPYCEEYKYEMVAGNNMVEIELIMNSENKTSNKITNEAPKETSNKITEVSLLEILTKEDLIKVIANITFKGDSNYQKNKLLEKIGKACINECNKTDWTLNKNLIQWILNY